MSIDYLGSIHTASDGLLSTSFYNYTTIAEFLPLQHNNQPQTQSENQNTPVKNTEVRFAYLKKSTSVYKSLTKEDKHVTI